MLRASLARYELVPPPVEGYHCTVSMSRAVWPDLANHRLSSVCRHCGISLSHHEAGSDAAACGSIALRCRHEMRASTLDDLAHTLRLRAGRL